MLKKNPPRARLYTPATSSAIPTAPRRGETCSPMPMISQCRVACFVSLATHGPRRTRTATPCEKMFSDHYSRPLQVDNGSGGGSYIHRTTVTIKAQARLGNSYFVCWMTTQGPHTIDSPTSLQTTLRTDHQSMRVAAFFHRYQGLGSSFRRAYLHPTYRQESKGWTFPA